jgi:5-bromo-4-chloroindolyl phosphate hydrolysis protein
MISLLIEFALFILVLFFLIPSVLIFLMIVRELILQHRRQAAWAKGQVREMPS